MAVGGTAPPNGLLPAGGFPFFTQRPLGVQTSATYIQSLLAPSNNRSVVGFRQADFYKSCTFICVQYLLSFSFMLLSKRLVYSGQLFLMLTSFSTIRRASS